MSDERFPPRQDPRPDDAAWPDMAWPPPASAVLTNDVITLRPFDPADTAELYACLDHDAVWAHVAGRPGGPQAMAEMLAKAPEVGRFPWVVRLEREQGGLPAGSIAGMTSYLDVSVGDARLEIGWTTYTPAVWGSLVNPSAKLLLLRHAFTELRCGRVQIKTDVRNHRSQQAIARLGAAYEGTLRRYQRRADGSVRDTVLFSVTAEDWPAVEAGLESRLG